ncbi:MAG: hypothetical protein AAFR17_06440 [Pseudomonadota bacterium]
MKLRLVTQPPTQRQTKPLPEPESDTRELPREFVELQVEPEDFENPNVSPAEERLEALYQAARKRFGQELPPGLDADQALAAYRELAAKGGKR